MDSDTDSLSKMSEGINHVYTDGEGLRGCPQGVAKWGKMAKMADGMEMSKNGEKKNETK